MMTPNQLLRLHSIRRHKTVYRISNKLRIAWTIDSFHAKISVLFRQSCELGG
jgi:hypothetical protein